MGVALNEATIQLWKAALLTSRYIYNTNMLVYRYSLLKLVSHLSTQDFSSCINLITIDSMYWQVHPIRESLHRLSSFSKGRIN